MYNPGRDAFCSTQAYSQDFYLCHLANATSKTVNARADLVATTYIHKGIQITQFV